MFMTGLEVKCFQNPFLWEIFCASMTMSNLKTDWNVETSDFSSEFKQLDLIRLCATEASCDRQLKNCGAMVQAIPCFLRLLLIMGPSTHVRPSLSIFLDRTFSSRPHKSWIQRTGAIHLVCVPSFLWRASAQVESFWLPFFVRQQITIFQSYMWLERKKKNQTFPNFLLQIPTSIFWQIKILYRFW